MLKHDKILTPELQEKLARCTPVNPKMEFKFVPEIYRKEVSKDLWPVFFLKGLSSSEAMQGDFYAEKDGKQSIVYGKYFLHYFRHGVTGWKNWVNPKTGEEIGFKSEYVSLLGGLTDAAINLFPEQMIIEIATAVIGQTELTPEELEGL